MHLPLRAQRASRALTTMRSVRAKPSRSSRVTASIVAMRSSEPRHTALAALLGQGNSYYYIEYPYPSKKNAVKNGSLA